MGTRFMLGHAMKITLTGAAGKLGSVACRLLAEAGHEVTATDAVYRADLPVRVQVADLRDGPSCFRLLEGAQAVVHLANHPQVVANNVLGCFNDNVVVNMNIFEAARQVGVAKIVFASSVQVCSGARAPGDAEGRSGLLYLPLDGAAPPNPGNPYALSKAVSEQMLAYYARQHGLSCVAVRFPALVEPEQLRRWRGFLRDDPAAYQNPDEGFAYLPYRDAAALLGAVLRADLPGFRTYLPAAADPLAPLPVAELIRRYFADVPLRRPIDQIAGLVDTSFLERETSWKPGPALDPCPAPPPR
jgi:nucleoside-diphosphate-sugar epimerase